MVEISRSLNWRILCDWGNDGSYGGTYDDISNRVDIRPGLTATRGRDPSRSLGEPRIPAFQYVGLNDDRFFSVDFPGSPIYQKPTVARPTRLDAFVGESYDADAAIDADAPIYADGTDTLQVFTGLTDRLTQSPGWNERRITMRSLGMMIRLRDRTKISTALYQNITTGEAMGHLLDAVGWPSGNRVISGTSVILKLWWLDREDPYSAAVDLLKTEGPGAALYEDALGRLVFEGQTYRTDTARSLSIQASFGVGGIPVQADPEHEDGADQIINVATYKVRERAIVGTPIAIWTYTPNLVLGASATKFFNIYAQDPFATPISPLVVTTDYTLFSGTLTAATVVQQNANLAVLTLTAGAGGAVVQNLQVRASPFPVVNETEATNAIDTSSSQTAYGIHGQDMTGRQEIDLNVAGSVCDVAVQRYQDPRAVNRFAILGTSGENIRQALVRQISDRIHYRESQTGQDQDAWIESLEWKAIDGLLACVVGAERTIAQGYARYDSAVYDTGVYGQ